MAIEAGKTQPSAKWKFRAPVPELQDGRVKWFVVAENSGWRCNVDVDDATGALDVESYRFFR